jgi:hypothetical protein
MTYRLFLDDQRDPPADGGNWIIVRSYTEAIDTLEAIGMPYFITFDHDLGEEKTGFDITKWIVNRDIDLEGKFIPVDFRFYVHSQNPIGASNINNYLANYLKQR